MLKEYKESRRQSTTNGQIDSNVVSNSKLKLDICKKLKTEKTTLKLIHSSLTKTPTVHVYKEGVLKSESGEGHFTPKNLVHLWQKSFCFQEKSIKNPYKSFCSEKISYAFSNE